MRDLPFENECMVANVEEPFKENLVPPDRMEQKRSKPRRGGVKVRRRMMIQKGACCDRGPGWGGTYMAAAAGG